MFGFSRLSIDNLCGVYLLQFIKTMVTQRTVPQQGSWKISTVTTMLSLSQRGTPPSRNHEANECPTYDINDYAPVRHKLILVRAR